MLASVLISRLGIFQVQRKNFTRGEWLKTQSKSHDIGTDVGGGENDATTKANVIILGVEGLSSGQGDQSYAKLPVTSSNAVRSRPHVFGASSWFQIYIIFYIYYILPVENFERVRI